MNFLKLIFWILVLVAFTYLATNNWYVVPINLLPGHDIIVCKNLDPVITQSGIGIPLPLLLGATFLIGFLPYFIIHRTTRWSLRRKLGEAKRQLEAVKHAPAPTGSQEEK